MSLAPVEGFVNGLEHRAFLDHPLGARRYFRKNIIEAAAAREVPVKAMRNY